MKTSALTIVVLATICAAGCQSTDREGAPGETARAGEAEWSAGWSQLEGGMDPADVFTLLDEPAAVKVGKVNTFWYYSKHGKEGAYVVFGTREMKLERWRAPR